MKWLGHLLDTLISRGRRKAVQACGGMILLTVMAGRLHGSFSEYRDGLLALLGLSLGAHVVQQATQKQEQHTPQ